MNFALLGISLVGGLVLSWATVSLSIRLAHRVGVLDHPDGGRKVQDRPIPTLGGVAVALSFTTSVVLLLVMVERPGEVALAAGVLIPALMAALIGYVDDRRNINPYLRLALQASVGLLVWGMGTRVSLFDNTYLDALIVIAWVMVVINGTNLLDNSDGLAASTVFVASAGATAIAVLYGQELVSLLGALLMGACLGYLRHNWFPARVYLGDSGAYFLATLLAVLSIRLRPEAAPGWVGVAIAVLLVLLPIVDTVYVVSKRLRAGIHPFTAGRDHLSHMIQLSGRSVPHSVLVLQAFSVFCSSTALVLALAFV